MQRRKMANSRIYKILDNRFNLIRELENTREVQKNLCKGDNAHQPERDYIQNHISELENILSDGEREASALIEKLGEVDYVAFSAGQQRFMQGLPWDAIAINHGLSVMCIKIRIYNAVDRIEKSEEV